ncbi:ABC transporter ATP-binding protein [Dactylosporangium sucinum]|uniref:ABC transporter ATP-binding protein n=1 Tax=Dactylosporangium sucinum TaxID=1424081 RepID=A0A917TUS7_9ACTN|nr:ABC transporter ATP-binding protein [Dactylosporangium sucinum]GGM36881.1 ABC transporter ATP-binding protein [Dactylosporangium sucinum]
MLRVDRVVSGYNRVRVLNGVDVCVQAGERVVVLGRNGMGKTTLAKTIVGLLPTGSGSVYLDGANITSLPAYRRTWAGIGYVPQGRGLFPRLTVEENLRIGLHGSRPKSKTISDDIYDYFPVLRQRRNQAAGTLSGGEQQQLAIGRALVGRPSVLILDEPSEGIQPNLVTAITDRLKSLATDHRMAVLLIEQNLDAARRFAQRCLFIEKGTVVHTCDAPELANTALVSRFLGV